MGERNILTLLAMTIGVIVSPTFAQYFDSQVLYRLPMATGTKPLRLSTQEGEKPKAAGPDKVDQAIGRAMKYLVSAQGKDGEIVDRPANQTAMTSLAILAMAAVGHQPSDDTPEGQAMKKALAFVLRADRQDGQGYLGGRDVSRMYGHGIATLMLTELLGMGVDAQMDQLLRDRSKKAVE